MKYYLLAFVCVMIATGCQSNTSPQGSNTIAGLVVLYDSTLYASEQTPIALDDYSGITVSIDGTNHQAVTGRDGRFQFDNIPNGTYDITATKPDFGTYHWYEESLLNGRLDLSVASLGRMQKQAPVIGMLDPQNDDQGFLIWTGEYNDYIPLEHYCDRDSTTSPSQAHVAAISTRSLQGGYTGHVLLKYNDLRSAGFHAGDTIYITSSTILYTPGASFYDPIHHQTRYSSCGPRSNVVRAVMP